MSTGYSPFFVNYGHHLFKGSNLCTEVRSESAQQFGECMSKVQKEVEASLKMAAKTMKQFYNQTKGESIQYKKGDKVWLKTTNVITKCPMKKLDNKCLRPFKILEKVGKSAYYLKLPSQQKIHNIFNKVLLSPYYPPQFKSQQQPLPFSPKIIDRQEEWEVECIKEAKVTAKGGVQFLVKWKGYSNEWNKQMFEKDLKNAPDIVKKFYKDHPNALCQLQIIDSDTLKPTWPTT